MIHNLRAALLGKAAVVFATALLTSSAAHAISLRVTVKNLAPEGGTFLTPAWVGFHDGSFDIYDTNRTASTALERLAEDGNAEPLSNDFIASGASRGNAQATIPGFADTPGPIDPGEKVSTVIDVHNSNRYFSYASMIIPSNDTFIANGDPLAHEVFDSKGKFKKTTFRVFGTGARDAGTEINDEVPGNTAFLAQAMANTGFDENGLVTIAAGFNAGGNILAAFPNADYTAPGYEIAEFTVAPVPLPAPLAMLLVGIAGLGGLKLRRRTAA